LSISDVRRRRRSTGLGEIIPAKAHSGEGAGVGATLRGSPREVDAANHPQACEILR
jgi:hypothetical protein